MSNMTKIRPYKYSLGFTIMELMVTLSIVTILSVIALPSFNSMTDKSTQRAATVDFIISVAFARTESTRRAEDVHMRNISNTGTWSSGWCITTKSDCSGDVIRRFNTPNGISIKANTTNLSNFTFDDQGFLNSASDTISFCTDTNDHKITITPVGHALVTDCTCNSSNICT